MDVLSINHIFIFLFLFLPGFLSMKVYDLLIAGDARDFSKSVLEVVAYSAINLAIFSGLIILLFTYKVYDIHPLIFLVAAFFIFVIAPIGWPLLYIYLIKQRWLQKYIVSPIRRPWDWFFTKKIAFWVIITLTDGRKIGGIYSENSYASSFPQPEQIYLEQIWNLTEDGKFLDPVPNSKGVLILGQISTIEFISN